jgi:resorcinol 4-hydroxylase (FADH2)
MHVSSVSPSLAQPDLPELLSRARAIAKVARERAQETEAQRRIANDVIKRMHDADLFSVLQPASYGGFEYGFDVFVQLVSTIGQAADQRLGGVRSSLRCA